jgi:hypothetical protein
MQAQKFLKALVVGLGVAIVLALGLVVYGVARLSKPAEAPVAATVPQEPAVIAPTEMADLKQPIGSEIAQILSYGEGRVAALVKGGMVPDRIVVIDLASGKTQSTIYVTAPDRAAHP